jgi:enoyl-CoA hydratase/carnithine racemase
MKSSGKKLLKKSVRQSLAIPGNPTSEAVDLHSVLARMESSSKPIVAALNGIAFGGGFEVAYSSPT